MSVSASVSVSVRRHGLARDETCECECEGEGEATVSAGVTTRFSLYVLIPVIPIIGSYVFEKLADQFVSGGGV